MPPSSDMTGVWLVVPAYNEAPRLARTLTALGETGASIVVVDDGSRDATAAIASQFPVWLVRHPLNCGQGAALQTGLEFALAHGAQILVTFDADGQHQADDLAQIIAPVVAGRVDVALGSRFLGSTDNMPRSRWLVLKLAVLFTRVVSRIRVTDAHNGLRAFSRRAAEQLQITQNGMAHASEILDQIHALGLSYEEVPVRIRYTEQTLAKGQSSWNALRIAGKFVLGRLIR